MRRTTAEHKRLACAMSLDRSVGRRCGTASHRRASLLPQEQSAGLALAVANLGKHLRRSRGVDGNARLGHLEGRATQGVEGGVGPVRDPVAAHALGERPTFFQRRLYHGLWTVAGHQALCQRGATAAG